MDLLKICIASSMLGILGIFLVSGLVEPTTYAIIDLSNDETGSSVAVEGIVEGLYTSEDGHSFITLSDSTGTINVVAFKGTELNGAKKGSEIRVMGKLDIYQQELEVVAKQIILLDSP